MTESHGIIEASSSHQQIGRVYDLWSRSYDYVAGPFERKFLRLALQRAALQTHENVLEVAVGTGWILREIVQQVGLNGKVFGVDLSPKMLAKTRKRVTNVKVQNVVLCRADARRLPFSDATFDVLFNGYMLDLISLADLPVVVGEFFRVVKPGGRLVLVNFSKSGTDQRTWWEAVYQRLPKSWAGYLLGGCRPVVMQTLVEKVGFVEINRDFHPGLLLPTEILTATKPLD